jgi:TetR/AcrR family transcriptional regulator, transcriptional repressor for nem operon
MGAMPSKQEAVPKAPPETQSAPLSTKDHLIDVGLELMRKHGFGATGLQEILQSAEVPKGSFYHHFNSKEDFALAVVERYESLSTEHCKEALSNTRQAPLKRLRRYFEDLLRMAGQSAPIQGCLLGSLSLEIASSSPVLQHLLSASFARWQSAVACVLREAVEKGELPRSIKPEALAGFILNSWEGALLRSQADKSDDPLRDFLRYTFEELLAHR